MSQRYDDDHLPHPDGCWVFHKDHERDLSALQRRVEEMEARIRAWLETCPTCDGEAVVQVDEDEYGPCDTCASLWRLVRSQS